MAAMIRRHTQQDDIALVASIVGGERERFDDLYHRFHGRVFGFALRRVGTPADAEDICQEVFLQVHRCLASYQGRASLSTWIFGIAHNITCRHFRSRGVQTVSLDSCEAAMRISVLPYAERQIDAARTVNKCTDTLRKQRTPEHLEIFRLFYGAGRPLKTIARSTGKPTESVKDSLRRSRNLLLRDVPDLRGSLSAMGVSA